MCAGASRIGRRREPQDVDDSSVDHLVALGRAALSVAPNEGLRDERDGNGFVFEKLGLMVSQEADHALCE